VGIAVSAPLRVGDVSTSRGNGRPLEVAAAEEALAAVVDRALDPALTLRAYVSYRPRLRPDIDELRLGEEKTA
jgi:hypothetical protein